MSPCDFTHLALQAIDGPIQGRSKLQKTIYFLGILCNSLENLDYLATFHGPESELVREAVLSLKSFGFLQEWVRTLSAERITGFESRRHDYLLTEAGRQVADAKIRAHPEEWQKLSSATARLKRAGDVDYMVMTISSKVLFALRDESKVVTAQAFRKEVDYLGWKPKPGQIANAMSYLRTLGLQERRRNVAKLNLGSTQESGRVRSLPRGRSLDL